MTGKERVLSALAHKEADRVPTGENQVNGELASTIIGRPTFCSTGWKEIQAVWEGKRDEVAEDYGRTSVDLVEKLEWDYVRVPFVPARKEYQTPEMTGPYSWIGEDGREMHFNPDAGNILQPSSYPTDMQVQDLPSSDSPYEIDTSQLEALRYVVEHLKNKTFIIARSISTLPGR